MNLSYCKGCGMAVRVAREASAHDNVAIYRCSVCGDTTFEVQRDASILDIIHAYCEADDKMRKEVRFV